MMARDMREALCALCRSLGWSYGVCWRFDRRDPRLLVLTDSYYEEHIATVIEKMMTQVHLVGEGIIGVEAIRGKHQWIYSDAYQMESSPLTSSIDNVGLFQEHAERQHQFLAGMKTIAIISLPSFGVVQFGSTKKIHESLEFVVQARHLFHQLGAIDGHHKSLHPYKNVGLYHPRKEFDQAISSQLSYVSRKSIDPLHDVLSRELHDKAESSTCSVLSSSILPIKSRSWRNLPSSLSVISSPSGASFSFSNQFQGTPSVSSISCNLMSQCIASGHESQLLPIKPIQSSYRFPTSSLAANLNANSCTNELTTLPLTEQRMLLRGLAANSHSSTSNVNQFQNYCDDPILSDCMQGSKSTMDGSGKFSSSSTSSPAKSSSKESSFASELLEIILSSPRDSAPEHNEVVQCKDDQIEHVHPSDNLNIQGRDVYTNARSQTISCSQSTDSRRCQAETSFMTAVNSLNMGYDWKELSSDAPTHLQLDSDLFEGMELDLNPVNLGLECWDDIIMPVSTTVSDMDLGSFGTVDKELLSELNFEHLPATDKGLFLESNFEQLSEAVISEGANLSSDVSPVGSIDKGHQVSVVPTVQCPQANTSRAPFPELSLEKFIHQFSKEFISKSCASSWIDESCAMKAESVVTNQHKKQEENVKVARKRARPGESTRPRPKDRQLIQDRVKELRELVPNGAKCSIDSLLDRTIKHMLFLQSVAKYADKLNQTDEPEMIGDASGVVLKDKSSSGGGATWAYEVAGQTMICPILVEDTNPPGQMLVEMLCEERGFFLEIADIIHGFGLTILKGTMEIRNSKIWARFLVEVNRDVTRMDIFLSLVQLLQQMCSIHMSEQQKTKAPDKGVQKCSNYQKSQVPVQIGSADRLQ